MAVLANIPFGFRAEAVASGAIAPVAAVGVPISWRWRPESVSCFKHVISTSGRDLCQFQAPPSSSTWEWTTNVLAAVIAARRGDAAVGMGGVLGRR